jgi:hypothetical protein
MRRLVVSVKACWRIEKECAAPYKAGVVLRSAPNNFCHFFHEVRVFWIMSASVCRNANKRCSGSVMVILTVSISHPRMRFFVENVASPCCIFFGGY